MAKFLVDSEPANESNFFLLLHSSGKMMMIKIKQALVIKNPRIIIKIIKKNQTNTLRDDDI